MPKPLVMGILNLTPDSFSSDGLALRPGEVVERAAQMVAEGAHILDFGGESTRPGAQPVTIQQEMERVLPAIEAVKSRLPVQLSVDTRHFEVAVEAVKLGVSILNDITAGADTRMTDLARKENCTYVFMHMQGEPQTMQKNPEYPRGVVPGVIDFLRGRVLASDLPREKVWVDPGIGFGKTLEHNLCLLKHLDRFQELGSRILIGTSRKSFLGAALSMEQRREGTLASNLWAWSRGASVFRVHDVGAMTRALKTWEAIESAS